MASVPLTPPRSSLRPDPGKGRSGEPTRPSLEIRIRWRRVELGLATAIVAGVASVMCASWTLALGFGNALAIVHDSTAGAGPIATALVARLGLMTAEALSALAIATLAGLLLLRCEVRPAMRDTVPFYARLAVIARLVGLLVVGALNARAWEVLLEGAGPKVLPALAAVQLVALVIASIGPARRKPGSSANVEG